MVKDSPASRRGPAPCAGYVLRLSAARIAVSLRLSRGASSLFPPPLSELAAWAVQPTISAAGSATSLHRYSCPLSLGATPRTEPALLVEMATTTLIPIPSGSTQLSSSPPASVTSAQSPSASGMESARAGQPMPFEPTLGQTPLWRHEVRKIQATRASRRRRGRQDGGCHNAL